MFAKSFLKSLTLCLLLIWAATGFYPFLPRVDFDLNPHFMPLSMSATFAIQMVAIVFCGIIGMIASIWCFGTYTGYKTGDGLASESLTAERMKAVPWLAPFAILWLSAVIFRCLQKLWNISSIESAFWSGALALLLLMALFIVIRGTFVRLFRSNETRSA